MVADSGNRCTYLLESFHSDAESNAGPDLNRFHLLKEVAFSVLFVFLIRLSRSTLDRDAMTLYGKGKGYSVVHI